MPPGKIMLDLNFDDVPPLGTPEEVEVTGGADDILSSGAGDGARFSPGDPSDPRPEAGHYLPLRSFQPGARGRASFSINEGSSTRATQQNGA